MNKIYGGAGEAFYRLKKQVIPDIIRRFEAARPEILEEAPSPEQMEHIAGHAFDHAVTLAVLFNREHQKDPLPYDNKVEKLDSITRAYIHAQDDVSLHMLTDEHRMTVISFFIVIGISRDVAQQIVDEIVLQPQEDEPQ